MTAPTCSPRPLSWWLALLAAGFPGVVILNTALNLYIGNAKFLVGGPQVLLPFVLAAAGLWVVLFAALNWGRTVGKVVWALPTAYAVFYLVRELAFPLPISELEEGMSWVPRTSHFYRGLEVVTFLGVLAALLLLRLQTVSLPAAVFSVVFGISAGITAAGNTDILSGQPSAVAPVASSGPAATDRPDVYQILFDEYQTVEHRYARRLKGVAPFDDFTCFTDSACIFNHTRMSLPSIWSGSVYNPNEEVHDWQVAGRTERSVFKALKEHGYRVKIYGYIRDWCTTPYADQVRCNPEVYQDAWKRVHYAALALSGEFLHVLKLRCLPTVLGRELFRTPVVDASGMPPDGAHSYYASMMFREMVSKIKDTPAGGNYTFLHVLMPHPPCVLDDDGNYVGPEKGTRWAHILQVDRLMGEFVAELKRLGRYDRSLIIVHSDTGAYLDPDLATQTLVDGKTLRPISDPDRGAESPDWRLDGRQWPLSVVRARVTPALVIKFPGQKGYREENAPVQLLDLYPTILGAAGIEVPHDVPREGFNLIAGMPPPDRVRKTYFYGALPPGVARDLPLQEWLIANGRFEKGKVQTLKGILNHDLLRH